MRFEEVKYIAKYYKAIPGMLKLLRQERADINNEYGGLHGMDMDGMPHGTTPGKPVEALCINAIENLYADELQRIEQREKELFADQATIRACLDSLNSKYKGIVMMRYVFGYSWGKISTRLSVPDSTARSWHDKAIIRLGEALEEKPGWEDILSRATRART